MRNQGAWTLRAAADDEATAGGVADDAELALLDWLERECVPGPDGPDAAAGSGSGPGSGAGRDADDALRGGPEGRRVRLRDGALARLVEERETNAAGRLLRLALVEDDRTTPHETRACLVHAGTEVEVHVEVRSGHAETPRRSMHLETRCPQPVRALVRQGRWHHGTTALTDAPVRFDGVEGGARLRALLDDPGRTLPIVVASSVDGRAMFEDVETGLARDACGIGAVAVLDEPGAAELTRLAGREWSCYNGAIRLFWPLERDDDPLRHPLWTLDRVLERHGSLERAAHFLRRAIRTRLTGEAALVNREPATVARIREAAMVRRLRGDDGDDPETWRELAEDAERRAARLAAELVALRGRVDALDDENRVLAWRLRGVESREPDPFGEDVVADVFPPPETVAEAVALVAARDGVRVRFGGDVEASIGTLLPNAGPPDKVLRHLTDLDALARACDAGPLGTSAVQWLVARGCMTSGESKSDKRSAAERRRRTFDACGRPEAFELHTKPSDGTRPNRCVRIYFRLDEATNDVIVGYVGAHL